MLLLESLQTHYKLRPRERTIFDGDKMHIVRENNVDALFESVSRMAEADSQDLVRSKQNQKYLGSLDPITAAQFKKESGLKIGTKEYAKYAIKKMQSRDYRRFSA